VNDLCGAVVRLAAKHGKSAPVNAKMCELIGQLKKGDAWTGSALRQALADMSRVKEQGQQSDDFDMQLGGPLAKNSKSTIWSIACLLNSTRRSQEKASR
jgi:hypothetical protein